MPTPDQIMIQSKSAYRQWAVQWRQNAKTHSATPMKDLSDFENTGVGRAILCIANGFSFEENVEAIRANQHNVDILCCDKTLGHCLDNGIQPTYCMVTDANVNFDRYMAKWKDQVKDVILFQNACGNPRWTYEAAWKDIYFYVNKDILKSEEEFCALSGCQNQIAAATNVSNAMVVLLTQSDNAGRRNFFGYDKILLIGYDYSWRMNGNYYAFEHDGGGKRQYMRHLYLMNLNCNYAYSSGNLAFSAQWLEKYVKTFNLPVLQCSKETIMPGKGFVDITEGMKYSFRPGDGAIVRQMVARKNALMTEAKSLEQRLRVMGKDHYYASLAL